jgi:hypothetical protein
MPYESIDEIGFLAHYWIKKEEVVTSRDNESWVMMVLSPQQKR